MKEFLNKLSAKENRTVLLLVLVAVVGILIFILTSATFPFKDLLFNRLFPKPPSKAATVFPNDPEPGAYVFDGWVRSIFATNNAVYFGGDFTHMGPNTGQGVPIATSSGKLASIYARVEGTVLASIPDGSGGW